jgi:hypothetical protein
MKADVSMYHAIGVSACCGERLGSCWLAFAQLNRWRRIFHFAQGFADQAGSPQLGNS